MLVNNFINPTRGNSSRAAASYSRHKISHRCTKENKEVKTQPNMLHKYTHKKKKDFEFQKRIASGTKVHLYLLDEHLMRLNLLPERSTSKKTFKG